MSTATLPDLDSVTTVELVSDHDRSNGQPTWAMVEFFPKQGEWTETQFLGLDVNRQIEFIDGRLEVLPLPTHLHQDIVDYVANLLRAKLGRSRVSSSLYRLKTAEGKFRQPDVIATNNSSDFTNDFATAADLVLEVISPGDANRHRDEVEKRAAYAEAGIPEYWIVDPENRSIVVLSLEGDKYVELGCYAAGQTAESKVIEGFSVVVDECFASMDD